MTTETPSNAPVVEPNTDMPVARTGADLRAHREILKLSVNDVSQRLKLQPRQVAAIERDDWGALPGTAFVRGSLRSYGKNLGIDVTPLLESIGGFARPADLQNAATLDTPMPRPGGGFDFHAEGAHRSWLIWAVVGVVGVMALTLFFGRDGDLTKVKSWIGNDPAKTNAAAKSVTSTSSVSLPDSSGNSGSPAAGGTVTESISPASGVATAGVATAGVASGSGAGAAGASGSATAPDAGKAGAKPAGGAATTIAAATPGTGPAAAAAAGATPAAGAKPGGKAAADAPATPAAAAEEQLHFTFAQTAWLEVKQLDGKVLFAGYGKVGAPKTISARVPVKITVGNSNQVQFEYHGSEYDMRPYAIDNVARFTLKE